MRNRAHYILSGIVKVVFDEILQSFLNLITDEKPITARQCVKALRVVIVSF